MRQLGYSDAKHLDAPSASATQVLLWFLYEYYIDNTFFLIVRSIWRKIEKVVPQAMAESNRGDDGAENTFDSSSRSSVSE